MSIGLAMEIPTAMLKRWGPKTDLDFVLAHKVLKDPVYARRFGPAGRPKGREVILDNSTHEFGKPLPMDGLIEACELIKPTFFVAPDIVREDMDAAQVSQNRKWVEETLQGPIGQTYGVAGVLCGQSESNIIQYLDQFSYELAMLCFTFHNPKRLEWWKIFEQWTTLDGDFDRIHLLGVSTLDELRKWVEISKEYTEIEFSVDTCKPLKWGAQLRRLDEVEKDQSSLQGGPLKSKEILELDEWTEEQITVTEYNIELLRAVCRGEA